MKMLAALFLKEPRGGIYMDELFITSLNIHKVRHLENIPIQLSTESKKHLVLTGRNGAGKTSLLLELKNTLESEFLMGVSSIMPVTAHMNHSHQEIFAESQKNNIVLTFFSADRSFKPEIPHEIKPIGGVSAGDPEVTASQSFHRFLVNADYDLLRAERDKDGLRTNHLKNWFSIVEDALRDIFDDNELTLQQNKSGYSFSINIKGREPFSFHQMADGYSAFFDVVAEIMMRMEFAKHYEYDMPGIVVIDEIEIHLHVDLQKKILPFLCKMFPKVQFIVSTHSPFVMSSLSDAIVYDLEKNIRYEDMSAYSYESIVEHFFGVDMYSRVIQEKFDEYKRLALALDLNEIEKNRLEQLSTELSIQILPSSKELHFAFQKTELERRVGRLD